MIGDRCLAEPIGDGFAGGGGVGHGLDRREGFRADDEKRGFERHKLQGVAEIGAIDIGDGVQSQMAWDKRRERPRGHGGTEVRAANADVHDIGKARAARGLDLAVADRLRESFHLGAFGENFRHDVVAPGEHWPARKIAQGHVQGRTVLGGIHRLAREERCPPCLDTGRAREIDKQPKRRFVYAVLREIEQEAVEFDMKTREPARITAKEIRDCLPGHGDLCASSAARASPTSSPAMRHLKY